MECCDRLVPTGMALFGTLSLWIFTVNAMAHFYGYLRHLPRVTVPSS